MTSGTAAVPDFMPATLQSCFPVSVCCHSIKRHCLFTILVKIDQGLFTILVKIDQGLFTILVKIDQGLFTILVKIDQGLFTILVLLLCIDWPGPIYMMSKAS